MIYHLCHNIIRHTEAFNIYFTNSLETINLQLHHPCACTLSNLFHSSCCIACFRFIIFLIPSSFSLHSSFSINFCISAFFTTWMLQSKLFFPHTSTRSPSNHSFPLECKWCCKNTSDRSLQLEEEPDLRGLMDFPRGNLTKYFNRMMLLIWISFKSWKGGEDLKNFYTNTCTQVCRMVILPSGHQTPATSKFETDVWLQQIPSQSVLSKPHPTPFPLRLGLLRHAAWRVLFLNLLLRKNSDGVPVGDEVIAVVTTGVPKVEDTAGLTVSLKPFDLRDYICIEILFSLAWVPEVLHSSCQSTKTTRLRSRGHLLSTGTTT